jgi:hypothetical protein
MVQLPHLKHPCWVLTRKMRWRKSNSSGVRVLHRGERVNLQRAVHKAAFPDSKVPLRVRTVCATSLHRFCMSTRADTCSASPPPDRTEQVATTAADDCCSVQTASTSTSATPSFASTPLYMLSSRDDADDDDFSDAEEWQEREDFINDVDSPRENVAEEDDRTHWSCTSSFETESTAAEDVLEEAYVWPPWDKPLPTHVCLNPLHFLHEKNTRTRWRKKM